MQNAIQAFGHAAVLAIIIPVAAQLPPGMSADVVGHLGAVTLTTSKAVFGASGDAPAGLMFKTDSVGSWKNVLFTANFDAAFPEAQERILANYPAQKTVSITCKDVTVFRLNGRATMLIGKGDHCSIDRLTTP